MSDLMSLNSKALEVAAKVVNSLRHVTTGDSWDDSFEDFTRLAIAAYLDEADTPVRWCVTHDGEPVEGGVDCVITDGFRILVRNQEEHMHPPSSTATREALDITERSMFESIEIVEFTKALGVTNTAAEAWSRIAPDDNGEWDDEVLHSQDGYPDVYELSPKAVEALESLGVSLARVAPTRIVAAVLAELHRLAEGSDE